MYHARPRFFIAIILVLPLLAAAPGTGESQVLVGGRAGAYLDHGDPFVGGEVLIGVEEDLYLNPNVELVFPERANKATFNFDLHYDFARRGRAFFWVGGGLAVIYVGGGEGGKALEKYGEVSWVTHVFTAGGTVLNALGSEPVPYLVALRLAAQK